MKTTRLVTAFLFGAVLVACTGGADSTPSVGQPSGGPSAAPTTGPTTPATLAPTSTPTSTPALDPSQSDAGVVGRAIVSGDTRDERDGTYDIIGTAGDGSVCEQSFSGEEFLVNATNESAEVGQIRAIFVSVRADELPTSDGQTIDGLEDGRAGVDFKSDSFVGTLYVGEPLDDERTSVSISITQSGSDLIFDFTAATWDDVTVTGQVVCGEVATAG